MSLKFIFVSFFLKNLNQNVEFKRFYEKLKI